MHLQLLVTIAAVFKPERFKLVVASRQSGWRQLQVTPRVAWRVFRSVDANEGAEAVVGVETEGERALLQHAEWDPDMEAQVYLWSVRADGLIAELRGTLQCSVAVSFGLRRAVGACRKLSHRP